MAQVLLATCAALPTGDEDAALLDQALDAAGITTSWAVWDDPDVKWAEADLVVVRSTWDYTARPTAFLAWAASVPRLCNAFTALEWSADKRYLLDLAHAGIPITPTFVAQDPVRPSLPSRGRVVVKPSVGAGSKGAGLFDAADVTGIEHHVGNLLAVGLVPLIQPYVDSVDVRGETDCVFINGVFSHAVEKGPMLNGGADDPSGLFMAERITPRLPSAAELEVAKRAVQAAHDRFGLASPLLYARVDMVESDAGPVVLELELVEPSLFFHHATAAATTFAAAVRSQLSGGALS